MVVPLQHILQHFIERFWSRRDSLKEQNILIAASDLHSSTTN